MFGCSTFNVQRERQVRGLGQLSRWWAERRYGERSWRTWRRRGRGSPNALAVHGLCVPWSPAARSACADAILQYPRAPDRRVSTTSIRHSGSFSSRLGGTQTSGQSTLQVVQAIVEGVKREATARREMTCSQLVMYRTRSTSSVDRANGVEERAASNHLDDFSKFMKFTRARGPVPDQATT